MQEIVAMSYTGPSHVEDSSGKYEGDISKGQKSGKGVMKFRNDDIYTGATPKPRRRELFRPPKRVVDIQG